MTSRYMNPYTDFGFKKIFGEEASKPLLMDFLNSLLPPYHQIARLEFKNTEKLGELDHDRKAVYDIYCENEKGEKFIVELQNSKQEYSKERTLYYTTFPIKEQAEKGKWNYALKAVYCIAILNFTFDDAKQDKDVVHTVNLKNQHNEVFYDKLHFIYLEMPKFIKTEAELENRRDKWLYFLKNLAALESIPSIFRDNEIFDQAFEVAELANLSRENLTQYEESLKHYWDMTSVMSSSFNEGKAEGIAETNLKHAQEMLAAGIDKALIKKITGVEYV